MTESRMDELEGLRRSFVATPAYQSGKIGAEVLEMLFRNNGLFDAITTEMTADEVPEGHIIVVTDKAVKVVPDFRSEEPPLTHEEFGERMSALGERVITMTDPRTNPVVSAFVGENPEALGHLPRT